MAIDKVKAFLRERGMVAAPPATRGAKKPSLLVRFLSLFVR